MTLLTQNSGCKVGWETYDNEAEAQKASERAAKDRDRMLTQGYDFGWLWPGEIRHVENHPEHGCDVWIVTTP